MPQEFHVLRCVECGMFQVHIVKKVAKWACKICQKKQCVIQEFARGGGKDCRLHVQRLNKLRLEQDTLPSAAIVSEDLVDCQEYDGDYEAQAESEGLGSKWEKYLGEKEESGEEFQDPEAGADDARVERKRKSKQQSVASTKKLAWCRAEDALEPCDDVERTKRGPDNGNIERTKKVPERERSSKQVLSSDAGVGSSKWAKFLDPLDEDDTGRGDLEADFGVGDDQEGDLDELLKL